MKLGAATYDPGKDLLLSAEGQVVDLPARTLAVLRLLVESDGGLLTKNQLLSSVWSDVHAGEDSLYKSISEIRRALKDDSRTILRTVPRLGYRLNIAERHTGSGMGRPSREPIRFVQSGDVRLGWTALGHGTPILKAPSWISNIETEADSLIFGPLFSHLGARGRFVYFDQRGSSLSSRDVVDWSVDAMVSDMKAVADAAGLDRFFLYGPSMGAVFSIAFAAQYPERVRGIIGRGAYATGWLKAEDNDNAQRRRYEISRQMIQAGWNDPYPEYRTFFTGMIIPDAPPDFVKEMKKIQAGAVDATAQVANLDLQANFDVRDLLPKVNCPVLLLHSKGDRTISVERAVEMASLLPDCELRILDGDNHIPVPGTSGFEQFIDAIEEFLDRHEVLDVEG